MSRPTVLLVEDNQLLRWCVTCSLQKEGCSVAAANSVEEALRLATVSAFDVLITDWRLADGHNGLEVLARVRENCPRTLAILISAEAGAELADRARTSGFDVVLEKPFPAAEIVNAVHNLALTHQIGRASC